MRRLIGRNALALGGLRRVTVTPAFSMSERVIVIIKNYIEGLTNADGTWVTKIEEIMDTTCVYFNNLFKSNIWGDFDRVLGCIHPCISETKNEKLEQSFTNKELKEALGQVDSRKALEVDGLPWLFYKSNWDTICNEVLIFCHYVLTSAKDIREINNTMIVLIPKVKDPKDMP